MSYMSGIYDPDPIQPVAAIRQNISVWTIGAWSHFKIQYIEPMPLNSQSTTDLVAVAGATQVAANGQIAAQLVTFMQLNEGEFLHLRWRCLDDIEGLLWEQSSVGRFVTRSLHCRVSLQTPMVDPHFATTTFFILGKDRDPQIEAQNPNPVAIPQARFQFWGFRYILSPLGTVDSKRIEEGQLQSTWLPAEGRGGR